MNRSVRWDLHKVRKDGYMMGDPKNLELSSGGQASYSKGSPYWVSVLGIHLYQYTSWWCCEKLCLASVNFFWRLFQRICSFHDGWLTSAPAHTALSVQQFLTKNSLTSIAHPPYSPDLAPSDFFFVSPDEKSPQRATFCQCGRGATKNGRSTKSHENPRVQKLFWIVEKCLNRCIASNGKCFEGDWSLRSLNKFFIHTFHFILGPPHILAHIIYTY